MVDTYLLNPAIHAKRNPRHRWTGALLAVAAVSSLCFLLSSQESLAEGPTDLLQGVSADDWPNWGRTGAEQHFSPLDEVSISNVKRLHLAWHYELESGYSLTQPLAVGGRLFTTTGHSRVRAFEATTGRLLWEYDGKTRERATSGLQTGWGTKGIAYGNGKIIVTTTDGLVIALDANTGSEVWKSRDFQLTDPIYNNGPPRVFGNKIIFGHGGGDVSPTRGYVSAYDLDTGKLAWRFYTVPGDPSKPPESKAMEVAAPTWKGAWFRNGGGGTAWNAFSYDAKLNLIYLGVGNGFPYAQSKRSPGGGDNLFLASIVAVNADTGEYVWHYQVCPAEQWDCTATADMTLAEIEIDGRQRQVLMQAPKNGFFYVLDRKTGELLSAEKVAKVTWAERIDMKTGRPLEDPQLRKQPPGKLFELWPGPLGAHSWLPQAFNPSTGLVYIPIIEQGALYGMAAPGSMSAMFNGVTLNTEAELPGTRRSFLKAWNPVTQKAAWQVELPGSWPAGVLTTSGGLVFQGRMDGSFVAYDARTGKVVWSFKAQSPIVAAPISFRAGGRQYITVLTGSGATGGGLQTIGNMRWRTDYRFPRHVLTFAIGGKDKLPRFDPPPQIPPSDPDFVFDAGKMAAGARTYGLCAVCHGHDAVAGGAAPDLRYSPVIVDPDAFRAIVKDGALKLNGMPPTTNFRESDLESIRYYLRARSKQPHDFYDRNSPGMGM